MRKTQTFTLLAGDILLCLSSLGCSAPLQSSLPTEQLSPAEATLPVLPSPTPEQLDQLEQASKDMAEVPEQVEGEINKQLYKLCNDRSKSYLKLPLSVVAPTFRLCAADLLQLSEVPVVLPPIVPKSLDDKQLHPYLELPSTNLNHYKIGLTWFPKDFYQANVAYFAGEKLTDQSPTLLAKYQEFSFPEVSRYDHARQISGRVALARGIVGYYIEGICGANCFGAYSSVIWDQQGYRYTIAIKLGRKAQVVEIVNTAIENQ